MKEGLETASMKAGKDILDRVKTLGEDMFAQYYKGSARHIPGKHEEDSDSDCDMEGGVMSVGVQQYDPRIHGNGYSGNGYSGNAMPMNTIGKMALGELGKVAGKVGAPLMEPCPPGYKDEGVTCSQTIPKKLKKLGKGRLEEHGADLIKMSKGVSHKMPDGSMMAGLTHPKKGKGKMECTHSEEGEGTHVRKVGSAKVPNEKLHGIKPSMATYEKQTLGKGRAEKEEASGRVESVGSGRATRAALVKKIMKEKGLSLPAASKYVKEHGLYKK
jgi:hypothetical protein